MGADHLSGGWKPKLPELERASSDASGSCCALASRECDKREKHKWQLALSFTHTHTHTCTQTHTHRRSSRPNCLLNITFCLFNSNVVEKIKLNNSTPNLGLFPLPLCPTGLENTLCWQDISRSWHCSTSESRLLHNVADLICKMQHVVCASECFTCR